MSTHCPKRWTGMMALVAGRMKRATSAGSTLKVAGSMSAKTGRGPSRVIALAVAKKVKLGTITSSPGPTSRAISANSRASLPEAQPTACWLRQ